MRLVYLTAAAVTAAACSDIATVTAPLRAPELASAAVWMNETTPVAYPVTNPCNGESALMTGTQHFMFSLNESNGTGSFSIRQQMTGVGASGLRYRSQFTLSDRFKLLPGSSLSLSSAASAAVITSGMSDEVENHDWHETVTFRFVVPANGVAPSVERMSITAECRGNRTAL